MIDPRITHTLRDQSFESLEQMYRAVHDDIIKLRDAMEAEDAEHMDEVQELLNERMEYLVAIIDAMRMCRPYTHYEPHVVRHSGITIL
jgi:hypothetical protein